MEPALAAAAVTATICSQRGPRISTTHTVPDRTKRVFGASAVFHLPTAAPYDCRALWDVDVLLRSS